MVEPWLLDAAAAYNRQSLDQRDGYRGLILLPIAHLETILDWAFNSLPDEILVGFDPMMDSPHPEDVDEAFAGKIIAQDYTKEKDSFSVNHILSIVVIPTLHHIPEEWVDEIFATDRGGRGGRFTHWLHTHPNAVAILPVQMRMQRSGPLASI